MKIEALIVTDYFFFVHNAITSAVKFVSNRMSYIKWEGCWSGIFLNVRSPADGNSGYKERFYAEVQHVFVQFPKYNMSISLGEEDIFKQSVGKEGLHVTS
jgi:hypothetical protein